MDNDVLNDDDGVIDDETDGSGEAAERHQVEALADGPKEQDGDGDRYGNDETGDQRGAPVAQEEKQDEAGQHQADEDGVAHTGDTLVHQL